MPKRNSSMIEKYFQAKNSRVKPYPLCCSSFTFRLFALKFHHFILLNFYEKIEAYL